MRQQSKTRLIRAALVLALALSTTACAQTADLSINSSGQGQIGFASTAIDELSGITYLGGDSFIVVSDANATIAPATIVIDRNTGQITSAALGTPVSITGGSDLEGIAFDSRDGSVLISDESGNTITRHLVADGSQTGSVTVPSIFASARGNRGLESLSLDPVGFGLWTANEEALTVDGPVSTSSTGTIVRLQRFDASGQPAAQFGYLTQPHAGDSTLFGITGQSGVSDLIALPGDRLIVMERELGGTFPSYRNRFYLIDESTADDTSSTPGLTPASNLVDKHLLIQVNAGLSNFEGVALGPMLSNGDYALILVSDDGAPNNPQNLLTLRLSGLAIEGDLNGDFVVDQDDLAVVLGAWGSSVAAGDRLAGDPSGDGQVGINDLDVVLAHWTNAQESLSVVPEPGSIASMSVGWMMLLRRW